MQLKIDIQENYIEYLNEDSTLDCYLVERGHLTQSTCNEITVKKSHGNNVVYFLLNRSESKQIKRQIYVGETTNLYNRMIDHNRKKSWWTHAVVFTGDKRKVSETCVMALEHLLIDKVKGCNKYVYSNLQDSKKDVEGASYDIKYNYILNLMEFLDYSLDDEESSKEEINNIEKPNTKNLELLDEINNRLIDAFPSVKFDQQMRYKTYYVFVSNTKVSLFALWPNLEVELYLDFDTAFEIAPSAYDISNRLRGNRKSAIKIKTKEDVNNLIKLVERMVKASKGEQ